MSYSVVKFNVAPSIFFNRRCINWGLEEVEEEQEEGGTCTLGATTTSREEVHLEGRWGRGGGGEVSGGGEVRSRGREVEGRQRRGGSMRERLQGRQGPLRKVGMGLASL